MARSSSNFPPLVAATILLLLVLYAGSYLALVLPGPPTYAPVPYPPWRKDTPTYRVFPAVAKKVYWPLEQLDRRVRPKAWDYPDPDA